MSRNVVAAAAIRPNEVGIYVRPRMNKISKLWWGYRMRRLQYCLYVHTYDPRRGTTRCIKLFKEEVEEIGEHDNPDCLQHSEYPIKR